MKSVENDAEGRYRTVYKAVFGDFEGKRIFRRTKRQWTDNIKNIWSRLCRYALDAAGSGNSPMSDS